MNSSADFDRVYKIVRAWEGGIVQIPGDSGGKTAYGITHGYYDGYRRRHGLPLRDVGEITEDEVLACYQEFWKDNQCSALAWPLNLVHFDSAFHSGAGHAAGWLKQSRWWQEAAVELQAYAYLTVRRVFVEKQPMFVRSHLNRLEYVRKAIWSVA